MNKNISKWELKEKENRKKGIITTIIIHGLLLLFLFFFFLLSPFPPPGEEGIMVNLGSMDFGSGDVQPSQIEEVTDQQPNTQKSANAQEDLLTQDIEDAPSVKDTKEQKDPQEDKEVTKEPTINPDALLTPDKIKNTSKGEGDDNIPGDKGVIDGNPDGKNYTGTNYGLGDEGIGLDLEGRQWFKKPHISDVSQEVGRVVILIKVDREGKVISATYQQKGSTTSNSYLISKAKKAALEAKFNPMPSAAIYQVGTITFNFKVH